MEDRGQSINVKRTEHGEWQEKPNWWGGKGVVKHRLFLEGIMDEYAESHVAEIIMPPGTYCGYHLHEGWEEILHIVSGKAEHFHNENRSILEPGDSVVVGKAGGAHAIRNMGDGDLKAVGFYTLPKDAKGSVKALPLPNALADWGQP